jgi:SOUL heme-binding protein
MEATLLAALKGAGLIGGLPTVAQYNPPWTIPPFRRNEILVELD